MRIVYIVEKETRQGRNWATNRDVLETSFSKRKAIRAAKKDWLRIKKSGNAWIYVWGYGYDAGLAGLSELSSEFSEKAVLWEYNAELVRKYPDYRLSGKIRYWQYKYKSFWHQFIDGYIK